MSKTVFITGTSTGFGKLTTLTLAKEGYKVIAGMRGITGKNKEVAQELSQLPNVDVVEIDVINDSSVQKAFEKTLQKHQKIDVLVNNAAVNGFGLLEAYSIDQVKNMFEVNFYGILRTYQAVLPSMRKNRSGLIINITSGASAHTLPFMIPYLASKFGVESITEGLQEELKQFGIDNVSIQPGVYPTEMGRNEKPGFHADKQEIAEAYEPVGSEQFNALGSAFQSKMEQYNPDPQIIADGIKELIEMEDGKRPLRFPLDIIAEGTDIEFIEARAEMKSRFLEKYMS